MNPDEDFNQREVTHRLYPCEGKYPCGLTAPFSAHPPSPQQCGA